MRLAKLLLVPAALAGSTSANTANIFEKLTPNLTAYALGVDFNTASFGVDVFDLSGHVFAVTNPAGTGLSLGCDAADFSGFVAGSIALVGRGTCPFTIKTGLAQGAGAISVLIANNSAGNANGLGGAGPGIIIPTYSTSLSLGNALLALATSGDLTVRMAAGNVAPTPGVPEPASWAMMIAGFALLGMAMRRRRIELRFA